MDRPMQGVRVLEVAQFTFVPAAGAVLADWGADIIKVEHAEMGDAQRGLVRVLGLDAGREGSSFAPIMEGPNRGKRSIGLALDKPEARSILEALVKDSDVFLTNYLPRVRRKLAIDLEDIRKINPDIIYVSGSGFGSEGPGAEEGAYDATAFWARGGSAYGVTAEDAEQVTFMPSGAYGDVIGGMTIAGGIAAALYGRNSTGQTSDLDVSLLAVGAWATQFTVNLALMNGGPLPRPKPQKSAVAGNPLTGNYMTADGRWLQLSMLQPGRYWAEFCRHIGRIDLIDHEDFNSVEKIMQNSQAASTIFADVIRQRTLAEWTEAFTGMKGQWAPVQSPWEVANDEDLIANGRIVDIIDADGKPQKLVANPVTFDHSPVTMTRAPQFAEHTDEILREIGLSDDELIELKIAGAVT